MARRCVNIDWLEVFCLEPITKPLDADFFRAEGFFVEERDYGTRVYNQMFTIIGTDYLPLLEVRRDPATTIMQRNACHLRLVNRRCYDDHAADLMASFIARYGYQFVRIARIDICLDFERFDSGDYPHHFVKRYLKGKYAKVNQGTIRAYGQDRWEGQDWNSMSWGALSSDVGTKLYDKTMELYDPTLGRFRKPYILQAWHSCGLIDDLTHCTITDPDGTPRRPRIWRVEFSIKSNSKKWYKIEVDGTAKKYQSIPNTLDMFDSREKLLTMFATLSRHYFRFKHYEEGRVKSKCPDKKLFDFDNIQEVYKLAGASLLGEGKDINPFAKLALKLRQLRQTYAQQDVRDACDILVPFLEAEDHRYLLANPYSSRELEALRLVLSRRLEDKELDAGFLLKTYRELMRMNENFAKPY